MVATRPAGGRFGRPVSVTVNRRKPGEPLVALNDRGDAAVLWVENHETATDVTFSVHGAFRTGSTGVFGPAVLVSPRGQSAAFPSASVGTDGRMALAWTEDNDPLRRVGARLRTAAGRLLPPQILTRHYAEATAVTALALGPGVVGWLSGDTGDDPDHRGNAPIRLQTAWAKADGTFGPRHTWFTTTTDYPLTPYLFGTDAGLLVVSPRGRVLPPPP
jgi:hypothetical protein